jgi:hypothetical protein
MNVLMNLSSHARAPLDHFATGCAAGLPIDANERLLRALSGNCVPT